MQRGYCGIGIVGCKTKVNSGTLWRSAHLFGAAFLVMIGPRYAVCKAREASDTTNARGHLPTFTFPDVGTFLQHGRPFDCPLIAVEQTPEARPLETFTHPLRALYLLGAEDRGLPDLVLNRAQHIVSIATPTCLNVAVAGSLVLYDRHVKQGGTRCQP